jgi:hypothetical protein
MRNVAVWSSVRFDYIAPRIRAEVVQLVTVGTFHVSFAPKVTGFIAFPKCREGP